MIRTRVHHQCNR